MALGSLLEALTRDRVIQQTRDDLDRAISARIAVPYSAAPYVTAALSEGMEQVVIVTPTDRVAYELVDQLQDFMSVNEVVMFPAWET